MPEYRFHVAMDIRTFGSATIEAENVDAAKESLTAAVVADTFEIHGHGEDDYDFHHPVNIWCNGEVHDNENNQHDLGEFDVEDGDWAPTNQQKLEAFVKKMASFVTPEDDAKENPNLYKDVADGLFHDMSDERCHSEILAFVEMIKTARTLLG